MWPVCILVSSACAFVVFRGAWRQLEHLFGPRKWLSDDETADEDVAKALQVSFILFYSTLCDETPWVLTPVII